MAYTSNAESTPVFKLPTPTVDPTTATAPPEKLAFPDKSRISAAAYRAARLFPGPIGDVLARELLAYADFGWRLERDGVMPRLVDVIMTTPEDAA